MQAHVDTEEDVVIVRLSGRIDVETAEPFRKVCFGHLMGKKVVFDFGALGFVGSTGILPFIETIRDFAERNEAGFKFSGVSSEFRRVFSSTTLGGVEVFDCASQAVRSFSQIAAQAPVAVEPVPVLDQTIRADGEES